jgi:hypothetical protein
MRHSSRALQALSRALSQAGPYTSLALTYPNGFLPFIYENALAIKGTTNVSAEPGCLRLNALPLPLPLCNPGQPLRLFQIAHIDDVSLGLEP